MTTINVEVVADSIHEGVRIVTLELTYPRILLAEANTHRMLSRNTASSRAIPVKVRCDAVDLDPFVPRAFGKNKRGMQSTELLEDDANQKATGLWLYAKAQAVWTARALAEIEVHKQYANRLTETFAHIKQLVTATDLDNFLNLRDHVDAQPEFAELASKIRVALENSSPCQLYTGEWHLPYVKASDYDAALELFSPNTWNLDSRVWDLLVKVSVSRCAAISYEKHDLVKSFDEEVEKHNKFLESGHMSPLEHQAQVATKEQIDKYAYFVKQEDMFVPKYIGNFAVPWLQYRKTIAGEAVFTR